jgi:hypothetical protein
MSGTTAGVVLVMEGTTRYMPPSESILLKLLPLLSFFMFMGSDCERQMWWTAAAAAAAPPGFCWIGGCGCGCDDDRASSSGSDDVLAITLVLVAPELNSLETADDLKLPAGRRLFTVCLSMKDGDRRGGLLGLLELEEDTGVVAMLLLVCCCPLLVEGGVVMMLMPPCVGVGR